MERFRCGGLEILFMKGDITEVEADAIVNAANKYLQHGGGVAGAIVRRGGQVIQEESDRIIRERGPLEVGDAVKTTAGRLKAKWVIHTVGPIKGEGDEESKIYRAVRNSLLLAKSEGLESIAFPAISTGVYRVEPEVSARGMIRAVKDFSRDPGSVKRVIFVLYTDDIYRVFLEEASRQLSRC